MADQRHEGFANYETWIVNTFIDQDETVLTYWREQARDVWRETEDRAPNQFLNHLENAEVMLGERLRDEFDTESDHPVFKATMDTVYGDLLNAALGRVEWQEIAEAILEAVLENDTDSAS